jgi:hypothetical protein
MKRATNRRSENDRPITQGHYYQDRAGRWFPYLPSIRDRPIDPGWVAPLGRGDVELAPRQPVASRKLVLDGVDLTFPGQTGKATKIGIFDAETGGHLLFWTKIHGKRLAPGDVLKGFLLTLPPD